jgi:hypothetical protein
MTSSTPFLRTLVRQAELPPWARPSPSTGA